MKKFTVTVFSIILIINIFVPCVVYSQDTADVAVWGENNNYDASWLGDYDSISHYYISDEFDLAAFKKACYIDGKSFKDKKVSLLSDIDLSNYYWLTLSVRSDEGKCFSGVFDGNGYSIEGLKMLPTGTFFADTAGFLPFIRNACVKNLNVECNVEQSNVANVGALCGLAADSAIYNCSSQSFISCKGSNDNYNTGYVGGLIGKADHCAIINCSSNSNITASNIVPNDFSFVSATGTMYIGGLIGWLSSESQESYCLLNSFSIGKVYAEQNYVFELSIGGLVGKSDDDIVNCYSACAVSGKGYKNIGSLVGDASLTKFDVNNSIIGNYVLDSLYYEDSAPFGNLDDDMATKLTSKNELCNLLNLNTFKVDNVIKEHRDILSNSTWADLVLACNADSFSAKSWQIYSNVADGYPSLYHLSISSSSSDESTTPLVATNDLKINRPVIKKIKRKNKSVKIYWKKVPSVTGYQIQLSAKKNFKKNRTKTVIVKSNKSLNKSIKASSNKKYYVRIRAYKTVDGKNYYSQWSKIKKFK